MPALEPPGDRPTLSEAELAVPCASPDLTRLEAQLHREQRARLVAEEAAERLRRLQAVAAAVAAAATPMEVARALVQQGLWALGAGAGGVFLVREEALALECLVAVGYPRDILAAWQWIPQAAPVPVAEAVRTRAPIWIQSAAASAARFPRLLEALAPIGSQAMAALPLLVATRVIGALVLTFEEERVFGTAERHLAQTLADQVAPALHRALRFASIQAANPQAIEALRRRDELIMAAAHDLKMPITAIKMSAQLLSHRLASGAWPDARRLVERLGQIDAAATRTGALLDELLALTRSRPEQPAGQTRSAVDLVTLVQRVAAEARSNQPAARVVVQADAAAAVGMWDSVQLERVFANLLDNAVKYSPRDTVVHVSLTIEAASDGLWAVVRIQDQGLGIPAADVARVFTRFQRGANVMGRVPGTGVGLASVRDIVEQHGGSVEVVSQEGQGSTFTVRLPLAVVR